MLKVSFSPYAQNEFDLAFDWYAKQSAESGLEFCTEVTEAIVSAQQSPSASAIIGRVHRAVFVNRYPCRIVYQIDDDAIVVVAVVHAKRRPRTE